MNKKVKNGLEMAAFTVPAIILVCLMMYVPFILSGYYSLTEWNGISKAVKFVGFTNFKTLFSQGGDFLPALWFTTKYTFCFVVFSNVLENFEEVEKLNVGAAIIVTGKLVATPEMKQPFEIQAEKIDVEGASTPDYPLQKKRHTFEYLRTIAHLR